MIIIKGLDDLEYRYDPMEHLIKFLDPGREVHRFTKDERTGEGVLTINSSELEILATKLEIEISRMNHLIELSRM